MIGIHNEQGGFHNRWVSYCDKQKIPYKLIDMFATDLVEELSGVKAVLWHHSQVKAKDVVVAKQILFALEHAGIPVFPDFRTGWHFDDKLAQKYLFEFTGVQCAKSIAFYRKEEALRWAEGARFPMVFKLRNGAGSNTVSLIRTKAEAKQVIRKAFRRGFKSFDSAGHLIDVIKKGKIVKNYRNVFRGLYRLFVPPVYTKVRGREYGYALFQEFIPNAGADYKVIVIGEKAVAIKRMVRSGDFRASGSGHISYAKEDIPEKVIAVAFDAAKKLQTQCAGFDVVEHENGAPFIIEVSYGWIPGALDDCPGYWDEQLNWHSGKYILQDWIIEDLLREMDHN